MRHRIMMFLSAFLMAATFVFTTGCYVKKEEVVREPPPPSYGPVEPGHWEWDGDEWEWDDD